MLPARERDTHSCPKSGSRWSKRPMRPRAEDHSFSAARSTAVMIINVASSYPDRRGKERTMQAITRHKKADEGQGQIFVRNETINARAITSVEGGAISGLLLAKQLIAGDEMTLLEIEAEPGVLSPSHAHAHESMLYGVKGKLRSVVAGEASVIGPGDACRHPRGVPHCVIRRIAGTDSDGSRAAFRRSRAVR